eukprot:scaffold404577_cov71-Attheya_sp.AAC.3
MEFEIDTSENNLDSTNDPVYDIGFLDQLDFDGDSIDTNLFDDDDLDMHSVRRTTPGRPQARNWRKI